MLRPRMRYLGWMLVAATAAFAIPAFAYSSPEPPATGTIHAIDPYAFENPETGENTVTIAPGGTVTFAYPQGGSLHNVAFDDPQPTSCTLTGSAEHVPPLPPLGAEDVPGWSGTCRFDTPGTYTFYCEVHGADRMSGEVVVGVATPTPTETSTSTPTVTQTQTPTVTQTQTQTPTATATTTPTASPSPTASASTATPTTEPSHQGSTAPPPPSTQNGTPAGPAAGAPKLAASQRGSAVRGTITIARSGSRLQVDLLAKRSALGTGHSGQVRVGRSSSTVKAGKASFSVALSAAAKKALRKKGRLTLSVKVTVTPTSGTPFTATRSVTVKR